MADIDKVQEKPKAEAQPAFESSVQPVVAKQEGDHRSVSSTRTAAANENEDDHEYPKGVKLGLITLALCLAVFLMALLMFGKFYTYFSIKWTFIVAITIFEIGSLVCGVAPTSDALIIGRAIAGIGSAGVFSGALIIIAHSVPLAKRPIFTGVIGAMYGLASVAGPLLGGVFTDKVTWRWCFYINLPIGAVTLIVIALFFKSPPRRKGAQIDTWRDGLRKFDSLGTLAFLPAIISLLLALQWGGTKYPWGNGRIIGLFVVFGVLIVVFIGIQIWKQDDATVPPRILKQRSILASAWFAFCLGASFFIMVFYIPIWFQAIKGTTAVKSGIDNLPMILGVVVASLLSGVAISATGYYAPWMILCTVLATVGGGLISTFEPDTMSPRWIGFQVIYGLGIGVGMQQPLMAAQTVLPLQDVPSGTAIIVFTQTVGGAIFISIAQNVFTNKLVTGIVKNAPGLNPGIVLGAGATMLKIAVPSEFLAGVIRAYNDALVTAFYVSIAMAGLTVFGSLTVEWKSVKKSGNGGAVMHAA
ncbi:hypothetical protein AAF712_002577 [Marasmius tenuissimus]|uniref:Major facilitator superfamily (MFS) profile domain-containing protein n=1 Tax=Marasmius tenuissimus TaxID=585030 RepID=A0ABR3A9A6_9AGAR